ncbi:hypothetical protein GCM10009813_20530 [Brevibacterium marinum]|uniref:Transposase n=2 Tax=Brevibacterium marinum TaxID=418643 RepID=A0A846RW03_9MICO|nr:hypothetical protein [Brevibacterium marinum]
MSKETLRVWVRKHKDSGKATPTESVDLKVENSRLRAEVAESKRASEMGYLRCLGKTGKSFARLHCLHYYRCESEIRTAWRQVMPGARLNHCHLRMAPSTLNVHQAFLVMRMNDLAKTLSTPLANNGLAHSVEKSDLAHQPSTFT